MDSREVMSLWVDRFSAEMHTIERRAACTVRYVSFGTCNRTGKEREATTIWQVRCQQGGGGSGLSKYNKYSVQHVPWFEVIAVTCSNAERCIVVLW